MSEAADRTDVKPSALILNDLQRAIISGSPLAPSPRIRAGSRRALTIYAKNEEENIPAHVLRKIKEELDG